MTEADWLTSTDPERMRRWLCGTSVYEDPLGRRASDRKLRLFACACCRAVWDGAECPHCHGHGHFNRGNDDYNTCREEGERYGFVGCDGTGRVGGLTDPRSKRAVEVAERYADGEATGLERSEAFLQATGFGGPAAVICQPSAVAAAHDVLDLVSLPPVALAALLRELFGNPFRPLVAWKGGSTEPERFGDKSFILPRQEMAYPGWLPHVRRWNDGTIPRIARDIYDGRRWEMMPILADALTDLGCDDEDILAHCRGEERCQKCLGGGLNDVGHPRGPIPCMFCVSGWVSLRGPHVRGCWVLDLILEKE